MRKFTIALIVLTGIGLIGYSQDAKKALKKKITKDYLDTRIDNMGYWMEKAKMGMVPFNQSIPVPPAEFKGNQINVKGIKSKESTDVPVTNLTNVTESENSVFVDPNNADYILNSNNSTSWSGGSVGSLYGANYFQSSNGGTTWGGSYQGAGGSNSGDPTTAIGLNGREYVNYISNAGGQGIAYSDDGSSWSTATIAPNPGSLADKNHMWIDNSPTSSYEGNLYTAWTDFGGSNDMDIVISRSTNDGVNWSSLQNLSSAVAAGSHNQGVNIQTGPNGEVYVCWAIYDGWPTDESAIGFAKSTNGGVSYSAGTRIVTNIKGIRTSEVAKSHRVNSFPVMAVDISGGPNNGNIYIVWTNIGTPGVNTGTNRSVYMVRSTDGGNTWSTAVRVNQGAFATGKEAYFPWISCDPETGVLTTVFYDDRNVASTQCEIWSAYSLDAGATWTDFKVGDYAFTPTPISGLASSYMGDYLGITSRGGKVYPCWTEYRSGLFMTYVSPYELGLNAAFTASSTSICTGSSVTFTDNSTGSPTSWSWSFPGGTPSSYVGENPPAITYSTPGTYDVSLTVGDGSEFDTETKTGYITVQNIIANFSGAPTTVVVGNTVTFTDLSSCNPTGWSWTFTGGTPSSYSGQTPPAITYNTLGTYDVSLTVTKPGSNDTETKTGYITVMPPEFNMQNGTVTTCTGNFYDSGGPSGDYANSENYTMTFYPSTSGDMIRFVFNSFSTESGYDYLRIYNGTSTSDPLMGTYNGTTGPGTVTASNVSGALTFNFTSDGSVISTGWSASISCYNNNQPPVADFSASLVAPAVGQSVVFTDLSTNIPTSWAWSFAPGTVSYVNGTSSASQNPEVVFNATGSYDVTLTATNTYGSDVETKVAYITVVEGNYNMANGTVTTCSGNFYDSGGPSGNYTNNENFTMTFYPATSGNMMRFVFSSFASESGWDYLYIYDGENTSAPLIGTYNGTTGPGTVMATNVAGALTFYWTSDGSVVYAGWAATISCYSTAAPPVADFSASSTTPPISSTVTFTDATTNIPTSWLWSFNPSTITYTNGTSATSQNPQVIFNELGLYDVTLTATNSYGSDSETKTDYINVTNCTYCTAGGSNGTEEWIGNVTMNTINNTSAVGSGYTDYTAISTSVTPGSVYPVSVTCGSIGSWTEHIWVFVDWNQDCDMVDTDESTDLADITGPGTLSGNITVPSDAVPGSTRIRVMLKYNGDPTPCEAYSYGETEDYTVVVAGQNVSVDITAFLEGPFVGTSMTQGLIGYVPLNQPYNAAPWNYNGTESVPIIPDHAIDWVLIELRDAASAGVAGSATRIGRQAAFLRNDGRVIGLTGTPILDFGALSISNSLFVVVHHRNHVSVISSVGLTEADGVYTYNFSTGSGQAYGGTNAHKQVGTGVWGMFAGDGNSDGSIEALDESSAWESNAGTQGYQLSDYNLDTQSNNVDKDSFWAPNMGKGTQVPN